MAFSGTTHTGPGTPGRSSGPGRGRLARIVRVAASRSGLALTVAGVATLAWAALATAPHGAFVEAGATTGPPCGAGELCIKESQVPTTAAAFGFDCGELTSSDPTQDLWHFVIPNGASFSTDTTHFTAIFSNPSTQIHATTIGGPNNKMAFVYSPAGATLTWAFATDVTGTAVQGYFVLSGTCPASQQSSSTTSSTTTTKTTTTSTTTSQTTTTSSTTVTGSVSGTTTSTASGGVQATSTTSSNPSGGVAGITITTPKTGADAGLMLGVLLIVGGTVSLGVTRRRRAG